MSAMCSVCSSSTVEDFPEEVRASMQRHLEIKQAYQNALDSCHAMWRPLIAQSEEQLVLPQMPNCWTAKVVFRDGTCYSDYNPIYKDMLITNTAINELLVHPKPKAFEIRIPTYLFYHIEDRLANGQLVREVENARGIPKKKVYIYKADEESVHIEPTETPHVWKLIHDSYSQCVKELITESNVFRLIGEIENVIK